MDMNKVLQCKWLWWSVRILFKGKIGKKYVRVKKTLYKGSLVLFIITNMYLELGLG